MPFKSKSQMRRFGEMVKSGDMTKEEFDKWAHETPDTKKLPERIHPKKPTGLQRLKNVKKI